MCYDVNVRIYNEEAIIVKFTKNELKNMEFNDAFELEEPGDYEEEDCCFICGNKLENLKIGFNKKEQLYKYECANCGSVYIVPKNTRSEEWVLLKGKERDWPKYLENTLKFPFIAEVIETTDQEFFDPNYNGPRRYDDAKVLEVFYSMKYGVEALIRIGRKTYEYILCFLEAADADTRNYEELENYKRWREKYWQSDYLAAFIGAFKKNKKNGASEEDDDEKLEELEEGDELGEEDDE